MKLQQLKTFLTVADLGSIRAAAKALYLSQPSVTRIVRELEEDLGVPLVLRSTTGVQLTEYGRLMRVRARLILEESRRLRDEIDQVKTGATGSCSVGVSALSALTLVPRAFEAFRRRMPGVDVHWTDGQLPFALPELRSGVLDFILADLKPSDALQDLDCEILLRTPQVVASRIKHPRARRRSLSALREDVWLTQDPPSIVQLFQRHGLPPPTSQRIVGGNSFILAVGVIGETDAVGLFSSTVMQHPLLQKTLRAVRIAEELPEAVVSIVTRRGAVLTPAAEALLNEIRRVAQAISQPT